MVAINNKFIFFIMIIFSLPAKVPLFLVKNKQTRFFLLISSFYSNIYCIFALTNALVAKLVDALDLGSSGLSVGVQVPSPAPFLRRLSSAGRASDL